MESTNSSADEEQARRLERIFQIFARTQEDWAMAHNPGTPTDDMEEDGDLSA